MTIQARIDALIAEADALRPLPEDEPMKAPLAGIVDEINELRAVQAAPGFVDGAEVVVKRKPGRPAKARIEGAEA